MTSQTRQFITLGCLLLASILTTTCSPFGRAAGDRSVRRASVTARQRQAALPVRLQQLIADGLTAQEVLGKCMWDSDWATLYRVIQTQDLGLREYTMLCTAARCEDPISTARALASGDRVVARDALEHSGAPYHRVLNTMRLLLPETGVSVWQALMLAMAPPPLGLGLHPNELANTLESPWPFNILPKAPGPADPALVNGRVEMRGDLPVITTWGTPLERGYAQGVLLADQLATAWESIFDRFFGRDKQRVRKTVDLVFDFPDWAMDEMKGLYLGVCAVLGEEGLAKHGNPTIQDVKALNCVADLQMMGCSSVSVWGDLVGDEEGIITGRNLDYLSSESLLTLNAVSVVHPGEGRTPFVSVGWLGLVGSHSAMNADGVCIFMHDSQTAAGVLPVDSTPRSMALREALETCDTADLPESIHKSLSNQFTVSGNNIHISWPDGAACIEWNSDEDTDAGATLRVPGDAEDGPNWLVVTNHYVSRHRNEALINGRGGSSGERYDFLRNAVLESVPGSVTQVEVLEWIRSVSRRSTLHSVIARPAQRKLMAYFQLPGTIEGAPHQTGIEFDVEALINAPVGTNNGTRETREHQNTP